MEKGRFRPAMVLAACVALAVTQARSARDEPAAPALDALPRLAESLAERLQGRTVEAPDGSRVAVVADGGGGLLNAARIETCLRTVDEAEAWPEAWLVVQVRSATFDLVMPLRLTPEGEIENPDPVFAAPRRDWDVDALRLAIREATGKKARGRVWNLVVQGFSQRVVERYVYDVPAERKGLLALLPEGSLLREARSVELGDGRAHTLALVLQDAEFVPSPCDSCAAKRAGHADTGRILLVLAGDRALDDQIDLTGLLAGPSGRAILPRYACEPGDAGAPAPTAIAARFEGRDLVPLIHLEDRDGDGRALEFTLRTALDRCDATRSLALGVDPATSRLRVIERP